MNTPLKSKEEVEEIIKKAYDYSQRWLEKYPEATEDYLIGLRDGYIAALSNEEIQSEHGNNVDADDPWGGVM